MYIKHSQLPLKYADSQKIWRYMKYKRFESLVHNESLFFCRADKFNDKWEGIFPVKMIEKFELDTRSFPSDDGTTYTRLQWHVQKEARSHLVNCWHVDDTESFAMWKIYCGDRPRSIAIQSTIGRLKRSFNANDERIWIGDVEYIDFREWEPDNRFFNVNTPNTLKAFFLKWHYFKYENEIRAVINKAYNKHRAEKGILVKIDLTELIDCIYVSQASSHEDEQAIKAILDEHGYSFPICRSDLGVSLYM
jgi:hypothetical protein